MIIFKPTLSRIGFISKLNGYAGEVVVIPETVSFNSLSKSEFLFVKMNGIAVPFKIENIFEKAGKIIVKFQDVNNKDYASRLLNADVLIESKRTSRKSKEKDWTDLAGFELVDNSYGSIGKIIRVEEYPQQVLATCIIKDKEVLIPLNEDFIEDIDLEEERIFITLPEGLLAVNG